MRRISLFLIFIALFSLIVASVSAQDKFVYVITINDDIINPATSEYISRSIKAAENDRAEALIIQLDTPGGLLTATRKIVKDELNANIPIVVYVAPSGSRAGSAGVFITIAAHIAAMAPSTNIGAAHPVDIGGDQEGWREAFKELEKKLRQMEREQEEAEKKTDEPEQPGEQPEPEEPVSDEAEPEEELESPGDTMGEKVLKDTVAWTRAIAELRGRNADWAVRAVTKSESITETEAFEKNVVDLVAADLDDLLQKIDGREVTLPDEVVTLNTKDARIVRHDMTFRQRVLNAISHPNIAYILMMLGFFGLLFEVTHPGIGFPGVAGAICLILAFYSFQALPVNYAGVLLIILALALFVAEVKVASYGLLTLGGLVCMTLGSIMLIDTPFEFMRVSYSVIFPMVFTTAAIFAFLVTLVIRAHSRRSSTGMDAFVGLVGAAETDISPDGKIFVHGEIWNAHSAKPIKKGEKVKVLKADGMLLEVEPLES
jgi:membrane-bound serine protease (ClpP class)